MHAGQIASPAAAGAALFLALEENAARSRLSRLYLNDNRGLGDATLGALGGALAAQGAAKAAPDAAPEGLTDVQLHWNNDNMGVPGVAALARGVRAAGRWLKILELRAWGTADRELKVDPSCGSLLCRAERAWQRRQEDGGQQQAASGAAAARQQQKEAVGASSSFLVAARGRRHRGGGGGARGGRDRQGRERRAGWRRSCGGKRHGAMNRGAGCRRGSSQRMPPPICSSNSLAAAGLRARGRFWCCGQEDWGPIQL